MCWSVRGRGRGTERERVCEGGRDIQNVRESDSVLELEGECQLSEREISKLRVIGGVIE